VLYLLDTCTLSYLEDPSSEFHTPTVEAVAALKADDEVCLSILTVYELEYGLKRAAGTLVSGIEAAKRDALEAFQILPLSYRIGAVPPTSASPSQSGRNDSPTPQPPGPMAAPPAVCEGQILAFGAPDGPCHRGEASAGLAGTSCQ